MKQPNRKQIKAAVINEVSQQFKKSYEAELEGLKANNKMLHETNNKLMKSNAELKEENEILSNKVIQYEDWIHRLQEWCNMPEDERNEAIKKYREDLTVMNTFNNLFAPYANIFNGLFNF